MISLAGRSPAPWIGSFPLLYPDPHVVDDGVSGPNGFRFPGVAAYAPPEVGGKCRARMTGIFRPLLHGGPGRAPTSQLSSAF